MLLKWVSSKTTFTCLLTLLVLTQVAPVARAESKSISVQRTDLRLADASNYSVDGKPEDWGSPSRGAIFTQSFDVKQDQGGSGGGEGRPEDWGSPSFWRDFGRFISWRPVLISLFGFIFSWQV